jgi:hypothetical protein
MVGMSDEPAVSLLVLYTTRWDECVAFYSGLGLPLVLEQHGSGPVHVAAELANGLVVEIYPEVEPDRATGRLRLELTVRAAESGREAGSHRLIDPDGRTVVAHVETGQAPDTPLR